MKEVNSLHWVEIIIRRMWGEGCPILKGEIKSDKAWSKCDASLNRGSRGRSSLGMKDTQSIERFPRV